MRFIAQTTAETVIEIVANRIGVCLKIKHRRQRRVNLFEPLRLQRQTKNFLAFSRAAAVLRDEYPFMMVIHAVAYRYLAVDICWWQF